MFLATYSEKMFESCREDMFIEIRSKIFWSFAGAPCYYEPG
jgi:hypothetical protein